MPTDGPCVFTGKTAICYGDEEFFDDYKGHVLVSNQPLSIGDKTVANIEALKREDILVTGGTFFYNGGRCC